eukprot:2502932-Amphidinium_carterae.1
MGRRVLSAIPTQQETAAGCGSPDAFWARSCHPNLLRQARFDAPTLVQHLRSLRLPCCQQSAVNLPWSPQAGKQ